jgi:hypothetical protein
MSPSLLSGLAGGLLATTVASTVFTLAGRDRPLPAARLVAQFVMVDGRPVDATWPGLALHVFAGTVAGGLFALILGAVIDPAGTVPLLSGVAWGVGYGLVLFVLHVGCVLGAILGVSIDRELLAEFFVLHTIYGTVMGGWIGLGVLRTVAGTTG